MLDVIGPYTWALVVLMGIMFIGAFLAARGLAGAIIGDIVLASAAGAFVSIVFYKGTLFPGTGISVGIAAGLAVLVIVGLGLVMKPHEATASGGGGTFRDRLPAFEAKSLIAVAIGSVFVLVGVIALVSNLDINTGQSADQGFEIATEEWDQQSTALMRRIERFLAK